MTYEELVSHAEGRLFIIGEAGVNHNGDLATAKLLVDAAVDAGCDAVKFQTWITERVYSRDLSVKPAYQKRSTGEESSAFDIIKRLELSVDSLRALKAHCDARDILFFSTPDERESADVLMELGVTLMKSASQDVTNLPFLRHLASLRLPLIFSTGASTAEEVDMAVDVMRAAGGQLIILHCVSSYPAPLEELNLRMIPALAQRYGLPVGFSDHTIGAEAACAALGLGARVFEKHFTLSKDQEGPDHQASATPDEMRHYVRVLRELREGLGDGVKRVMPVEADTRVAFRRFLVTAHPIARGTVLAEDDFLFKKTTEGLEPSMLDHFIGRTAVADLAADIPFRWEHIGGDGSSR
jgi:N,N'-diacetyllegionaminate synthase